MSHSPPIHPVGIILAGGQNSRFGCDKARIIVADERPLIHWIAHELSSKCVEITCVGSEAGAYADLAIHTITDRRPGLGPLAGLEAALLDSPDVEWFVMVPCDCVGFDPAWIDLWIEAACPGDQAVAFRRDDHWEPLPAMYNRSCLTLVQSHLDQQRRSMQSLLDAASARAVERPADWPEIISVNTPDELSRWRRNQ